MSGRQAAKKTTKGNSISPARKGRRRLTREEAGISKRTNSETRSLLREACRLIIEEGADKNLFLKNSRIKLSTLNAWLRDGKWKRPDRLCARGSQPHLPPEAELIFAEFLHGLALAGLQSTLIIGKLPFN